MRFVLLVFRFTHLLDVQAQIYQATVDVTNDDTSNMMVLQLMNTAIYKGQFGLIGLPVYTFLYRSIFYSLYLILIVCVHEINKIK
jgi:hypothetical protein